ncbi:hypothetical protein SDC9_187562 [bioreactor metagenome]|jgi:hypothetical protein|uniref:Uncharacterized protein n=1 Tax=bioreactor metagenome TaxID=1076179 RepID=A0A645HM65_9ZZZZ
MTEKIGDARYKKGGKEKNKDSHYVIIFKKI